MELPTTLAREIMTTPLVIVDPNSPLKEVVHQMARYHISDVIVQEKGKKDAYMITHGDIIRWLDIHTRNIRRLRAKHLMHGPVMPVLETDSIQKAIQIMCDKGIKRVLVENDEGDKVGIITVKDILLWNSTLLKEGTPYVLVAVAKDTGVLLFEYQFPVPADFSLLSTDLLGLGLTAIGSMTSELLQQSGELRVIRKEKYVIMLEETKYLKGILVANQESIGLRKGLQEFVADAENLNIDFLTKMGGNVPIIMDKLSLKEAAMSSFAPFILTE
jgi:CBS domain-containing protein